MQCADKDIYYLGEFSDPNIENEFFQQDMRKSLHFIKPIGLMLGVLNTLFLIPDYYFLENQQAFLPIAFCILICKYRFCNHVL